MDTNTKRRVTDNLKLKACLLGLSLSLSMSLSLALSAACQEEAPSILPARPDAINGGNPFEGLGRPDDPNPSRVGDFLEPNTSASASAPGSADAPVDPNLTSDTPNTPSQKEDEAAADTTDSTPGAAEALLKAQQLAKEGDTASTANTTDPDADPQKPGLLDPDTTSAPTANKIQVSFFTVVADSPIRTTLVDIREGRYEAALNQLKIMYERNPAAIELQYLMAVSAVKLRRNTEAIEHYRRVLDDRLAPLRLKQLAQKGLDKIQPK